MYKVEEFFLLFISYAIIGWMVEEVNEIITTKKFVNRGFLIGPYCPIYGFGGLLITIFLTKYKDDPVVLFILSVLICSILEYFTSYILEKFFDARWWDYSTRKYNINGRICFETIIPFGLLGFIMIYLINPYIVKFFKIIPPNILHIVVIIIFCVFLIDIIVSLTVLRRIKDDIEKVDLDNTEEITKKIKSSILSGNWIRKRFGIAYPNIKFIGNRIKTNITKVLTKEKLKQEKLRIDTQAKIEKKKLENEYKIQKLKKRTQNKMDKLNK